MSLALHIIAVNENYCSLGHGQCVIRKFTGKYQSLDVGDNVVLHHTADAQSHDLPGGQAVQKLKVHSVIIGTFDTLWDDHRYDLHDFRMGEDDSPDHLLKHYPLADGEERNPDELFVAIYF